ncbi:MAG: protein TolR [Syntrophobacteraceae bacterium CG2_30_61_12]|nr:MAG: protein TolR [Syntrophobacteraceae bacterium CG2_30_61_12]
MQMSSRDQGMVSEINVTPLVDVMLVLLIIFMVTAPMMMQGVDVDLPEADAPAIQSEQERLVVSIGADRKIFINEYVVELEALGPKIGAIYRNQRNHQGIFLRADKNIPYGFVMQVMGTIRQAGISEIGMVTEPGPGEAG